jgi:hypothetical protein
MRPVTIPNETHILTAKFANVEPLSVRRRLFDGRMITSAAFQLSEQEKTALAAGGEVYLHILGSDWSPCRLTVTGTREHNDFMTEPDMAGS